MRPRSFRLALARNVVLALPLLAGCATNTEALLDSGLPPVADAPAVTDLGTDVPTQPVTCGDGGLLPDGACRPDAGYSDATSDGSTPPPPPPPPPPHPPTPPCNDVTFAYANASAMSVWVSGSWVRWAATPAAGALPMTRGTGGAWSLSTRIETTGRQQYKFIVTDSTGAHWIADPSNPTRVSDGQGGENSVIDVCGGPTPMSCGELTAFDWRDAVMYFAMTDRFSDSDGMRMQVSGATDGDATRGASGQYAGGDLAGLRNRVPYLANLGVTALWISAPYKARDTAGAAIDARADPHQYSSYHGYWPSPDNVSYADPRNPTPAPRVEPRIGSAADLRALVTAAHGATAPGGHGIRVLFDYVMKHVDVESGLYRAHNDWFVRDTTGQFRLCADGDLWNDSYWGTRCAFTSYLPSFEYTNDAARAWSVSDAVWWAREYGIDGLRLDAIKHVPRAWLTDLRARLNREITPSMGSRFYLVGETFDYDNREVLRSFVDPGTMLDGQFDFPFKARICEALFTPGGRLDSFAGWMQGNDSFYGTTSLMSTFIGNHDIPRAIHFASRQITDCRQGSYPGNSWSMDYRQPAEAAPYERLGLAFAVMLTNPGVPLIYYGDEIGLAGGGDPDNRRMMPWADSALNPAQIALRQRVSTLARIRAENPVVARGARTTLSSSQDTWVYRMSGCTGGRDVIVALNRADDARMVTMPTGAFTDLMASASMTVMGGSVSVPPRSVLVWRAQ